MEEPTMADPTKATEAAGSRITVRCACGWEVTGTEDEAVEATVEHGRRLHNMEATRESVLGMAAPAVEDRPA
jgi:predicted small metal-binding protein